MSLVEAELGYFARAELAWILPTPYQEERAPGWQRRSVAHLEEPAPRTVGLARDVRRALLPAVSEAFRRLRRVYELRLLLEEAHALPLRPGETTRLAELARFGGLRSAAIVWKGLPRFRREELMGT